ncbi:MAG: 23S rRNA (adenine(2503)-C(2))-methyltransferase RlmN [Candidatus Omnitrophota bacterium]
MSVLPATSPAIKSDLKDLSLADLEEWLKENNFPGYHARQIFSWVYKRGCGDFSGMSDLPVRLRARLVQQFSLMTPQLIKKELSKDGTRKFLFRIADDCAIESVIIPTEKRNTACISSQAGCKFKCAFCLSGASGWQRNLTTAEILGQLLVLNKLIAPQKITHIVFMGVGEPLDNYENVLRAARLINSKDGLGLAARRITISTCGVIPAIARLSREGLQIELSVSLHAADNQKRNRLMPVNKKYPLEKLIKACRDYAAATKRQVTFEYLLIKDLNCGPEDAKNLAGLMKGWDCKMNLIPYNPIKGISFATPEKLTALFFQDQLFNAGVHLTLRKPRGADIQAACGQLRFCLSP